MRSKRNIGWVIVAVVALVVILVRWFCDNQGQFLCDVVGNGFSGG